MQRYLKNLSIKKTVVIASLFGFFFAYISSISVFRVGEVLESGSTSISSSLIGSKVADNINTSSSANLLDATKAKVTVTIDGSVLYFSDLESAIAAIPDNKTYTLTLMRNIELNKEIKIPANRNLIIDGRGQYSIIRSQKKYSNWHTDRMIYIDKTSKLTLRNLTVDLNNKWTLDEEEYNNALMVQESIPADSFIKSEMSAPSANTWVIYNNGDLKIENTTIKNHFSKSYGLIYGGKKSNVTLKNTEITHCAVLEGGVLAYLSSKGTNLYLEEGTTISDNFAGGNGGIIRVQGGAKVTMNGAEITSNKSINSDGFIAMLAGEDSTFTLNDGLISENSGITGLVNQYNGAFYIHSGGVFEMNGGIIENNTGFRRGAIDIAKTTADIKLNAGTIQNNKTYASYENYTGLYLGNDYDFTVGKKMKINDNIYVTGDLKNNGTINGDVIIDAQDKRKNILTGSGKINGDLVIKYLAYDGDDTPSVSTKNVKGDAILYNEISQVLVTFEYNGGVDEDGFSRNMISQELDLVPILPTPTKPGHTLTWYKDKTLTEVWDETAISENTVLYAGWTINNYTVTWNINGSIITRKFNYNEIIQMPEEPVKTGYDFVGWEGYEEGMRMPDQDITFVAKWKKTK